MYLGNFVYFNHGLTMVMFGCQKQRFFEPLSNPGKYKNSHKFNDGTGKSHYEFLETSISFTCQVSKHKTINKLLIHFKRFIIHFLKRNWSLLM